MAANFLYFLKIKFCFQTNNFYVGFSSVSMFMWVPFRTQIIQIIQMIFVMLNVVKDVGQVGNHEIILIWNHKIKRQRICHDQKREL